MGFSDKFEKKERKEGFAEATQASRQEPVYFVRSQSAAGEDVWFILKVEVIRQKAFLKALEGTEPFDLTDFGTVLHSGYGCAPPEALQKQLVADGLIDPLYL